MTSARSTICSGEACAGGTCRVIWLRKTSRMEHSSNFNGAHGTCAPLTFMISQRLGYSFSECETRLVELLGNPQRFPKDTSQRSVSRKGEKTLKARHA